MSTKKNSITVPEAIKKYSNKHLGEVVTAKDIIDDLMWEYQFNKESILPSDYVWNPDKNRKVKMRNVLLFCKVGHGQYYCTGCNPSFADKLRFLRRR